MRGSIIVFMLLVAGMLGIEREHASADELEHDRCFCKIALKGAESTLRGGVCVRTEAATCLMEWGGGSSGKTSGGNGLSQREAGERAQTEFNKAFDARSAIPRIGSMPDNATPLEVAFYDLSRVPPKDYATPGIVESFLLIAGSALERYYDAGQPDRGPLSSLAGSLAKERREQLIKLVQDGGEMKVEQFLVRGNIGCLIIADRSKQPLTVYVKTPFAISDRC
jgi:hypothetical protein